MDTVLGLNQISEFIQTAPSVSDRILTSKAELVGVAGNTFQHHSWTRYIPPATKGLKPVAYKRNGSCQQYHERNW